MSATNRGTKRRPHDFYPTPIPSIEAFLDVFPLRGIEVLEPGAGSGNIIKTLQKYGDFSIDAVEIRPEETEHLQQLGVNVIIGDYLSMNIGKKYDLIIGNPPFNQAIEFVERSLELLKPDGMLVFYSVPHLWRATGVFRSGRNQSTKSQGSTHYTPGRASRGTGPTPQATRGLYGSPAAGARQ